MSSTEASVVGNVGGEPIQSVDPAPSTEPRCPLCGAAPNDSLQWTGAYTIFRCSACGLMYACPLPSVDELRDFYQGFMYRRPDMAKLSGALSRKGAELRGYRPVDQHPRTPPRFLDYGGGTGITYAAARGLGYEADFFELDEQAIAFVIDSWGLDEQHAFRSNEQLVSHGSRYDLIMSDNVIEHLLDPIGHLRFLYSLLAPGGVLVVKTPNAANIQLWFHPRIPYKYARTALRRAGIGAAVKVVTRRWWNCDPPRHLYSFSADSLQVCLERAGIDPAEGRVQKYWAPLWEYSLTRQFVRPTASLKGVVARLGVSPLLPVEWVSKAAEWGFRTAGVLQGAGNSLIVCKPELN